MGIRQQEQEQEQEQEQVAVGANDKRRRPPSHEEEHDDEEDHHRRQQQQADADADADADDHHLKLKKRARQMLPASWMRDEVAALLPRALTEYTDEDAARFDEDMARADKMVDDFNARVASFDPVTSRRPPVPFITPGLLLHDEQNKEEVVVVGDLRVSKADAKMLRSFVATGGHYPCSERFLSNRSLLTQAAADSLRRTDRLFSKVFAWTQEGAREVLRHYDAAIANGGTSPDAAITVNPSTGPADH